MSRRITTTITRVVELLNDSAEKCEQTNTPTTPPAKTFDDSKWREADFDLCMLCYARGADKRTFTIYCGYEVNEVIPDAIKRENAGYSLRVCKTCRGELLIHMGAAANKRKALRTADKSSDGYIH